MSRATVLLLGASSQIGVFAIPELCAAGFSVVAISRKPRPSWYPELDQVRWMQLDAWQASGRPADFLISAGPIELAAQVLAGASRQQHASVMPDAGEDAFEAGQRVNRPDQLEHQYRGPASLTRAVVFSTSSVFSKLESHDREEKRRMQRILMQEARLSAACEAHDIALTLFRPTLIYGCGMDGNVSWLARWIKRFGFMPVAGRATGLRQPVHAHDLARTAVAALQRSAAISLDVPLCGGSTLSFHEMVERIFSALDRPVRMLHIPERLFAGGALVARVVPGLGGVRPEMVRRENVDLVFDDSTAKLELGHTPRRFAPAAEQFQLPEVESLIRMAAG